MQLSMEKKKMCKKFSIQEKKKKIRTATDIKLVGVKKNMQSAQQHCLYLRDRIKNSNDSHAIQPHKNRIDTENDEKVYKVA